MRVAVITEVSTKTKNQDVINALSGRGLEVFNVGMTGQGEETELTYIDTGLMSALALWTESVDLVIGGCGTGQGFYNSCLQYPGVSCGLAAEPLDAFLLSQINNVNCISLALNKGYGWAADLNLKYLFDVYFSVTPGNGYPPARSESQKQSRIKLAEISAFAHKDMKEILKCFDRALIDKLLALEGFREMIEKSAKNTVNKDYLFSL